MKTYKVLATHLGDKLYVPNDPETGTRIADPNEVGHLVTLGLLEETGDAPDAPAADDAALLERLRDPERGPQMLVDLKERFAAFERERQELRDTLTASQDAERTLIAERDDAREQLATAQSDLAEARQQIETLTKPATPAEEVATGDAGDKPAQRRRKDA